ncbi:MAG: YibE/F family protein [Deltaproteobacteria bacterium]|nr:YibE/F family protein [Deltaproteobacteria bacterium]
MLIQNVNQLVKNRDAVLALFLTAICFFLLWAPTGFENRQPAGSQYARARITALDNARLKQHVLVKTGFQDLTVEILDGPFQGRTERAVNYLTGKLEIDEFYLAGQTILLEFSADQGRITTSHPRGVYRLGVEIWLFGLFGVLLIASGGWTGLRALLSFVFAALMIWKVMVPCFLKGYDPVLLGLAVVTCLIGAVSFLVGGLNRTGLVTFLGSFIGLNLTYLLSKIFYKLFWVHGAIRPFSEMLLYTGFPHLDLGKIFLAGIFTASSGAIMDVAMDISVSMHELKLKNPDVSLREHLASGMAVGRAVIGTMTTTLLLAYSGGYVTMLMVFMGQGIPLRNIFNLNLVSAEVLDTLVGSFGVVLVAPVTVLIGGLMFRRGPNAAFNQPEVGRNQPELD